MTDECVHVACFRPRMNEASRLQAQDPCRLSTAARTAGRTSSARAPSADSPCFPDDTWIPSLEFDEIRHHADGLDATMPHTLGDMPRSHASLPHSSAHVIADAKIRLIPPTTLAFSASDTERNASWFPTFALWPHQGGSAA